MLEEFFFPPQRNLSFWVSLQLLSESFSRRGAELRPERRCRISFRHTGNEGRAEPPRRRRQKNPNIELMLAQIQDTLLLFVWIQNDLFYGDF